MPTAARDFVSRGPVSKNTRVAGTLANSPTKDEPQRVRSAFEAAGHSVEVRDVDGAKLEDGTKTINAWKALLKQHATAVDEIKKLL